MTTTASTICMQRGSHLTLAVGLAAVLGLAGCSGSAVKDVAKQEVARAATPAVTGVVVQPQKLQALARPPAKSGTKTATASRAGKGKTSMSTANATRDTDVIWVEEIDIDGDGNAETATLLWDDEDKVLFVATQDDLVCKSGVGKTAFAEEHGGVLIAIFGEGNPYQRPVGSGWYVAYLDAGQCQARAAGIFGCDFDAAGRAVACGAATLDEKTDTVTIVAQRMP